jgi:hypothetical protein
LHFSEKLFCPGLFAAVYHTFKPPEKKGKTGRQKDPPPLPGGGCAIFMSMMKMIHSFRVRLDFSIGRKAGINNC